VIDTATNTIIALVDLPQFSVPCCVAVTPDGLRVYVANLGNHTVSVIETVTNTVTATVPVEGGPTGVAVTPDGSRVYVTMRSASPDDKRGAVAVIDPATNTMTATVLVGGMQPEAFGIFIPGLERVPFAGFSARASIDSHSGAFSVYGGFTLRAGRTINLGTDNVTIKVGGFSAAIPGKSFVQGDTGNNSRARDALDQDAQTTDARGEVFFAGAVNNVHLAVLIVPRGDGGYAFAVTASGVPAGALPANNPVPVGLTIGANTGTTQITVHF